MSKTLLRQSVSDFNDQLPESVREAFEKFVLRALVESRLQIGTSIQEVLKGVNRIAERRGVIANPELLKKHERIRCRKVTLPKQVPDS